MIIDLPTRRVYKADATSEYSIWYSYHSWLFCRLSQQDVHGLRGNGSSDKERTNKIQSEHARLPCNRPNLIYFQKIIVFFFLKHLSGPVSKILESDWLIPRAPAVHVFPFGKKEKIFPLHCNKQTLTTSKYSFESTPTNPTFLAIENSTEVTWRALLKKRILTRDA